ncbi:hypothetical protein KKD03_03350 [Patescibacteria group bacterium]|nr:hypothetical protein [Patescibacteria group bacterium]
MKNMLTNGLLEGYTKGNAENITRGNFEGKRSIVVTNAGTYHDEWFVTSYSGGGQELVNTPSGSYTRLYGGGTPKLEELSKLNITAQDVNSYLKKMILKLKNTTRLTTDNIPKPDEKWQYSYKVTGKHEFTDVVTATEIITYGGVEVHVHAFILCPIL